MKCRNCKCKHYEHKQYSGCEEYNMKSIEKCPDFKKDFDFEEIEDDYPTTLTDNWADLNCDACGNTITDAEGEL